MDKKAVMYVVAALAIILIVALVIKPMMTKQPANETVQFSQNSSQPPTAGGVNPNTSTNGSALAKVSVTLSPTLSAKPTPTRNLSVQSIGFVDPSTYHLSLGESIPNGTPINQTPFRNTNRTTIATISGRFSGTTQIIDIPYPYWELVYTVQPSTGSVLGKVEVTPTKGQGVSSSGASGSYSTVAPEFTLQVIDGNDPNRIVRTISPPGGIDLNLWLGKKKTVTNPQETIKGQLATTPTDTPYSDPRPWTEKFFEGQRTYYFIITTHSLDSYTIQIRVPSTYIGKY
jgi:hypothetical protein